MESNKKLKQIHFEKIKFSTLLIDALSSKSEKELQSNAITNLILELLYEEPEVIFKEMISLIKERKINLKEIFSLLLMIYSSVEPSIEFEFLSQLKFEIFQYFMNEKSNDNILSTTLKFSDSFDEYDKKRWELQIDEFLTNFMKKLELIKNQREDFKEIRKLYKRESSLSSFYSPLFMSLCDVIEQEKNLVDLQKNISLLQSLKKSSLGFFSSFIESSDQFTCDQFVLFVVGGMTMNEISLLNSIQKGNKKFIFGTNTIIKTDDLLKEFLIDI